ncbi:MAG: hypothetical protein JSU68_06265 [Phycisphaerales bacterium]|nr:MAG: hypothetical protein JSU68_06265 [Phycisphaerales bacterium]
MRSCLFSLIITLALAAPACKNKEPPVDPDIAAAMNDDAGIGTPKNQGPPYECFGNPTEEEPEVDVSLEVQQDGVRLNLVVTAAETRGLRLCSVWVHVRHNSFNEETEQWKWDGHYCPVLIKRLEPYEVRTESTPATDAEFPSVTEPGPPESWTVLVDHIADVRKP